MKTVPHAFHRGSWPASAARFAASLLASLAATGVLPAQTAPAPVSPALLARYDTNRDGRLDAAEEAAMRAAESRAQGAANAGASTNPSANTGDVVVLSPFEVNESNNGYFASNTT